MFCENLAIFASYILLTGVGYELAHVIKTNNIKAILFKRN